MVSEDDFRKDMDKLLKRRKILKTQRNSIISNYIAHMSAYGLDAILEQEIRTTMAYEKRNK
jgi:hypothetical protein